MGSEPYPLPLEFLAGIKDPRERRRYYMQERARLMDGAGRHATPWPMEAMLAECETDEERAEVVAFIREDIRRRSSHKTPLWDTVLVWFVIMLLGIGSGLLVSMVLP